MIDPNHLISFCLINLLGLWPIKTDFVSTTLAPEAPLQQLCDFCFSSVFSQLAAYFHGFVAKGTTKSKQGKTKEQQKEHHICISRFYSCFHVFSYLFVSCIFAIEKPLPIKTTCRLIHCLFLFSIFCVFCASKVLRCGAW